MNRDSLSTIPDTKEEMFDLMDGLEGENFFAYLGLYVGQLIKATEVKDQMGLQARTSIVFINETLKALHECEMPKGLKEELKDEVLSAVFDTLKRMDSADNQFPYDEDKQVLH